MVRTAASFLHVSQKLQFQDALDESRLHRTAWFWVRGRHNACKRHKPVMQIDQAPIFLVQLAQNDRIRHALPAAATA
jgi:hypothetical protein